MVSSSLLFPKMVALDRSSTSLNISVLLEDVSLVSGTILVPTQFYNANPTFCSLCRTYIKN